MAEFKNDMTDTEFESLLQDVVDFAESNEVAEKYKKLNQPIFIDSNQDLEVPAFVSRERS